ncbi:MAG TPA: SCO family protein [Bosea sp. (in: a-proteobacteria)]
MPRGLARRTLLAGLAGSAIARAQAQSKGGHIHGSAGQTAPDPLAGRFGGPFSLIDHHGRRVGDDAYRGRFMLVYFGFTRCTDTCPVDLPTMAQALDVLGPLAQRVAPLFITVDPAHDTPPVLAANVAAFHPALIGLTGSEVEIAAVAKAYKVHRRKLTQPHHGAGEYAVDHGSLTYLMDRDGRFLTLLPHKTGAERMAAVLRSYLA